MKYTNTKSSQSGTSANPTTLNLQTRPFASIQTDSDQDDKITDGVSLQPKLVSSENLLAKLIATPIPKPSATPIRRKLFPSMRSQSMPIQAKLNIGEPNDKYEKEADNTAARVVQQINSSPQEQSVQREESMEEEDEDLQMKSLVQRRENVGGGEASSDLESSIQSARGSGQSLDPNLQIKMGQAMGADFSGVKVHTDSQSDQLNKSIQAKAFTTGQDVFFRQGSYNPSSTDGQELIAHELTHVVQQNGGAVQRSTLSLNSRYLQRALLTKLTKEPTYSDGLDYATIISSALDKEPAPKKVGATWDGKDNRAARKTFRDVCGIDDVNKMDAAVTNKLLLQPGEIHGNTLYMNKSGDLPATTTYKEYDTAKYTGDPRLRGSDRIVVGADGKKYYTSNHYTDFAEFD